ncbi:unnamed protein product [Brassica napus]|uniref:Glutamate receptor n=1 Tax=Brassica napus TaxID=3708 RepID=A0A817ANJ4_BRANA|nr:unnamed protein product [Brassica napus]
MMNPTKANNIFLGVPFIWGFMLMNVGLGKSPTSEIKIGIVLDLQTPFSKICLTSINMSLSDFYENHSNYTTRIAIHVRDSLEDAVQASAAALDLIKNEKVSAIIGPRSSLQAEFMIRLANKSQVPVITFSATSPLLTSTKTPYFVRATLNDLLQVRAIAAIVKSFEWRSVVAIYVDNEFGEGIMPYLADALQDVHTCVTIRSVISLEASNDQITNQLYKLMTMQTRVFVAHMPPNLGFRVIQKARDIGMMGEGYVWIFTDGMTNWIGSTEHGSNLENMQGVLGLRSRIPNSKELGNFSLRWEKIFGQANAKPNVFALRAYDSITALAVAVEKTNTKNLRYDNLISAFLNNTTDLGTLGVSRYGPSLLKSLSDVDFNGLAGKFKLVNMELESSTFDIINFIAKEERIIGSWTQSNGLVNENPTSERLGPVIWPGRSTVIPRGWEIPTDGKKTFKVGVPLKRGFLGFVDVKQDPRKATIPTGYSIEVFEAALKRLPYSVIHRYVTFDTPNHSYDTLVEQVHNGMFDAAVGDITIRANRFVSVDFTLPYTESGVFMLVPMKDNENNTWFFLLPWSLGLWVTTACFFIFIGFIVWILEHRVNTDFRGPPHHQIGTSFWFSFSTINFAHREKVVSNLARFVVIVWCFVVLVLTQSYTANLTSFLTVQRLKPEVTTVNELIENKEIVGYQNGSFVLEFLIKKGFQGYQLKPYNSAEECHNLLINGTSKGGIAAAFDEVAYLKLIISQYCNKYAIVEPSFKSSGFGFVFPKNSPLTDDVSRAILEVIENDEMQQIENKWFSKKSNCSDPTFIPSHNRLSVSSFWGLFLIVGVTSLLALLVFVAFFFYEHRHTLYEDSEISFWRKLTILVRSFDEKDIKSHMFKDSAVHNVSSPSTQCTPRSSTMQNIPWPQNPSENMEFELRRVSPVPSEEFSTPQLEQDEDEEANTLREVE